jgi:hypothetical protein
MPALREVNAQIYRLTRYFDGPSEYICECAAPDCHSMLAVSSSEFAAILAAPGHRLVASGHDGGGLATVREGGGYVVIADRLAEPSPLV